MNPTTGAPLTDEQLADVQALVDAATTIVMLAPATGRALLAEVRRLRAQQAAVTELLDQQELAARAFEVPLPEWVTVVRQAVAEDAAAPA